MSKFIDGVYKIICDVANEWWWPMWSNVRFKKYIRNNIPVLDEHKISNLTELKKVVKNLYKRFNYTADGIDVLWDAITPPPQNYQYWLNGEVKDDCDGFHSLLYHVLHANNIECHLLSVCAIGSGHCVLLTKYNEKYRVIDYNTVHKEFETIEEAVKYYNEQYKKEYKPKGEVLCNYLFGYDYENGKIKFEQKVKI